jgi:hypothetical protein
MIPSHNPPENGKSPILIIMFVLIAVNVKGETRVDFTLTPLHLRWDGEIAGANMDYCSPRAGHEPTTG